MFGLCATCHALNLTNMYLVNPVWARLDATTRLTEVQQFYDLFFNLSKKSCSCFCKDLNGQIAKNGNICPDV